MLDELFSLIAESELLVNNLFELDDGRWQANLRERSPDRESNKEIFHEFGYGATPHDALITALARAGYDVTEG